jgi:hypothetical protein
MKMSKNDFLENIKQWYNGYSWDIGNYWFASATPTFLVNHMKNRKKDITTLERENEEVKESFQLIGVGFDQEERNISHYKVEPVRNP